MIPLPPCCTPSPEATPAERAYCAYNAAGDPATAGLNFAGQPCPVWSALPENVRAKWEAAVGEVASFDEPIRSAAMDLAEETGVTQIPVGIQYGKHFIAVGVLTIDNSEVTVPDDDQLPLFGRAPVAAEA